MRNLSSLRMLGRRVGVGVFLSLLLLSTMSPIAYAVDDPDSISIESVRVFQNLWETGDQLFFVEYKVMYDSDPDEDADETFFVGLYNGSTLNYSRPLNYYDHNIIAIYLDSTEAVYWGGDFSLKVSGNPTFFSNLSEETNIVTWSLTEGQWITGSQADSRIYLGLWCVGVADSLQDSWGIPLLTSGDRLNVAGALTFKEAVPGLDGICSSIFQVSVSLMDVPTPTYNQSYQANLSTNIGGRLQGAMDDLGSIMGMPGFVVGGVGLAGIFFLLAGRVFVATGSQSAAVVLALPVLILGNLIGLVPLALTFSLGLIVVVLAAIVFILGRFA